MLKNCSCSRSPTKKKKNDNSKSPTYTHTHPKKRRKKGRHTQTHTQKKKGAPQRERERERERDTPAHARQLSRGSGHPPGLLATAAKRQAERSPACRHKSRARSFSWLGGWLGWLWWSWIGGFGVVKTLNHVGWCLGLVVLEWSKASWLLVA